MPVPSQVATQSARPEGRQGAPVAKVPFVRAAQRQSMDANIDVTRTLTASSQRVGTFELPATGFLRYVDILVTASGGDAGLATVAAAADAPWSVIDQISLVDPAGQPIFGPMTGYQFYLANFVGGYFGDQSDPANFSAYTAVDSDGDFTFLLRVPIEASARDGYASLTNQDSSAAYRLNVTMAAASSVYSTEPDTLPDVRFQATMRVWTQPTATNMQGQPQEIAPPGSGTLQFWTYETNSLVSGENRIRLKRVGNLIRNLILVTRDSSGDRLANSDLPDPMRVDWDTLVLAEEPRETRLNEMETEYGVALPAGVYVYSFCADLDGKPGFELRNALLPTTPATRLDFRGSWSANAAGGSLEVIVNDILPVGLA